MGSEPVRDFCRLLDGSENKRVFFDGTLGGVLDPGGDTILEGFTFPSAGLALDLPVVLATAGSDSRLLSPIAAKLLPGFVRTKRR